MDFRQGRLTVHDPAAGELELEGDGFAAAGELVTLVVNPAVERWLGMTPDEISHAQQIVAWYRDAVSRAYAVQGRSQEDMSAEALKARQAAERGLAALFGPTRTRRLKQLSWRIRDADALWDEDVAEALGIDPSQRQALERARLERARSARESARPLSAIRVKTPAEFEARARAAQESADRPLLDVLTPDQRARFERLQSDTPPP